MPLKNFVLRSGGDGLKAPQFARALWEVGLLCSLGLPTCL